MGLPSGYQTNVGNSALGRHLPTLGTLQIQIQIQIQAAYQFPTPKAQEKHGSLSPPLPPDHQGPRAEAVPAHLSEPHSSL